MIDISYVRVGRRQQKERVRDDDKKKGVMVKIRRDDDKKKGVTVKGGSDDA